MKKDEKNIKLNELAGNNLEGMANQTKETLYQKFASRDNNTYKPVRIINQFFRSHSLSGRKDYSINFIIKLNNKVYIDCIYK